VSFRIEIRRIDIVQHSGAQVMRFELALYTAARLAAAISRSPIAAHSPEERAENARDASRALHGKHVRLVEHGAQAADGERGLVQRLHEARMRVVRRRAPDDGLATATTRIGSGCAPTRANGIRPRNVPVSMRATAPLDRTQPVITQPERSDAGS
jgi:hypothetical protein